MCKIIIVAALTFVVASALFAAENPPSAGGVKVKIEATFPDECQLGQSTGVVFVITNPGEQAVVVERIRTTGVNPSLDLSLVRRYPGEFAQISDAQMKFKYSAQQIEGRAVHLALVLPHQTLRATARLRVLEPDTVLEATAWTVSTEDLAKAYLPLTTDPEGVIFDRSGTGALQGFSSVEEWVTDSVDRLPPRAVLFDPPPTAAGEVIPITLQGLCKGQLGYPLADVTKDMAARGETLKTATWSSMLNAWFAETSAGFRYIRRESDPQPLPPFPWLLIDRIDIEEELLFTADDEDAAALLSTWGRLADSQSLPRQGYYVPVARVRDMLKRIHAAHGQVGVINLLPYIQGFNVAMRNGN